MIGKALMPISFCWVILECTTPFFSRAQDNYEIQVYGSQTIARGFNKSFHGVNKNPGYVFSPNAKAAYNISGTVAMSFEYYGSFGSVNHFQTYQSQQHQFFAATESILG